MSGCMQCQSRGLSALACVSLPPPSLSSCSRPARGGSGRRPARPSFFFFNDTATTAIYTLSLHDALPICQAEPLPRSQRPHPLPLQPELLDQLRRLRRHRVRRLQRPPGRRRLRGERPAFEPVRSEEHTSELQSLAYLVCRLLLEKKKTNHLTSDTHYNTLANPAHLRSGDTATLHTSIGGVGPSALSLARCIHLRVLSLPGCPYVP